MASHADYMIKKLCNTPIWMDGGKIVAYDAVDRVIMAYGKRPPLLAQSAAEPAGAAITAPN